MAKRIPDKELLFEVLYCSEEVWGSVVCLIHGEDKKREF